MMNRVVTVVIGLLVLSGGLGVVYWSSSESQEVARTWTPSETTFDEFDEAQRLLSDGKYEQAYEVIQRYRVGHTESDFTERWQELELTVLGELDAYPQIYRLYQQHPQLFAEREETLIKTARFLLQYRDWDGFDHIMADWAERGEDQVEWFFLAVDRLVGQRQREEAVALLETREFDGEDEINRLLRLTMLTTNAELNKAWEYLAKAHSIDEKNMEVRVLRGRLLEKIDKPMLAHVEFRAALLADASDPVARDQLADFYRRQKQFRLALTTWGKGLKENSSDKIWLSTWFWNRVGIPVVFDWQSKEVPNGPVRPLVNYLLTLKPNQFWDEESFPQVPQVQAFTRMAQETFWLRLLDHLQQGREQQALELLTSNSFAQLSWAPGLENALRQILSYRLSGNIPVNQAASSEEGAAAATAHVLYQQLDQVAREATTKPLDVVLPEDLHDLISGEEAFTAAFLAEGWHEAALAFHHFPVLPKNYPVWVTYELVRAMDSNRTTEEALDFVKRQEARPLVRLLTAELMLQGEDASEARRILEGLIDETGAIGFRAAIVLATMHIEEEDYPQARRVVQRRPGLAGHLAGKELSARIAYLTGEQAEADRIYEQIADDSFVAQSYLARRAFEDGNFARAKELTMRMIQAKPDLLELRASLNKILEAQEQQGEG